MTQGRHKTTKSKNNPTYNSQWSGVTFAPTAPGKTCSKCGNHVHKEGDSYYCPFCDDYVKTASKRTYKPKTKTSKREEFYGYAPPRSQANRLREKGYHEAQYEPLFPSYTEEQARKQVNEFHKHGYLAQSFKMVDEDGRVRPWWRVFYKKIK